MLLRETTIASPVATLNGGGIVLSSASCGLLRDRGPATVRGFVVPIAVHSVDPVIQRRALTHIIEEILEHLPSLGNANASTSVAVVRGGSGVAAPIAHGHPRAVGGSAEASELCRPVFENSAVSAAESLAGIQVCRCRIGDVPTGTLTHPGSPLSVGRQAKNSELPKDQSSEVVLCSHVSISSANIVAHMEDNIG